MVRTGMWALEELSKGLGQAESKDLSYAPAEQYSISIQQPQTLFALSFQAGRTDRKLEEK